MDFGLDKFVINLFKEHWLFISVVILAIILLRFLWEEIPYFINRFLNNISFKNGLEWREDQDLLHWLRGLNPTEFEKYVATLFGNLGYSAEAVGQAGDHGIDVKIEKDGIVSYIQCKKYSNKHKVGEPEVRNFLGSLDHKHAQGKGYFVTTGIFTLHAERFAEDKPIELVDGLALIKYIRLAEKNVGN